MTRLRLGYVNVAVSDLERSVRFFRDVLGLPVKFVHEDFGYAAFDLPGTGFALARADDPATVGYHTGIGFVVDDLDAAHRALADEGVDFVRPPTHEPWGGYMAMFTDPDGNVFYLDQVEGS